jgi:glycosyltransferase involved in cell wall biosynthesis
MSISILIPAYNEQDNILNTYKNLIKAMRIVKLIDFEIIFINDGSADNSLKIIRKISKYNKKIEIINNKKNLGLSTSILKGIKQAKKEFVWWLPSDNNVKYKEISKVISNYSNLDFLLTTHIIKRNFFRHFISHGYTVLINFLFSLKIPYFNGLFMVRKKIIKKIKIKSKSQFWMAELTINLLRFSDNYEIRTIKLVERKKGTSNIFNFRQFYLTLADLLRFRFGFL